MVIAEVRNEIATVRIHDEYYQKETRQAMSEINRIVSQAYQRRVSTAAPVLFENVSMRAVNH